MSPRCGLGTVSTRPSSACLTNPDLCDTQRRDVESLRHADENPLLDDLLERLSTGLEGRTGRNYAAEASHFGTV